VGVGSQLFGIPCYALSNKIGQNIGQKLAINWPRTRAGQQKITRRRARFFLVLRFLP